MKAFFFDRDGTLNIDTGYINNPGSITLYQDVKDTLKFIKSINYSIFIITNQSGIGRRNIKPGDYRSVNHEFLTNVGRNIIDEILFCPHIPANNCSCRKPNTLLLEIILDHYKINTSQSYFVGDKISDIACGKNFGLKTIQILHDGSSYEATDEIIKPDEIVYSISELLSIL